MTKILSAFLFTGALLVSAGCDRPACGDGGCSKSKPACTMECCAKTKADCKTCGTCSKPAEKPAAPPAAQPAPAK